MMKKHAVMVILLAGVVAVVVTLAPPSGAAAPPQPTLTLTPSSGPCDATVEVEGTVRPDQAQFLWLYLVQPGTVNANMGTLNDGFVPAAGQFKATAPLWQHGCEAAALDSQSAQPTGHISIALSAKEAPAQPTARPGEEIPDVIAVAQYVYTTTVVRPRPALTLSPSSGPCDGAVDVKGTSFAPRGDISLQLRLPNSEDNVGTLGSAVVDAGGRFTVRVTLGELGCYAAQLYMRFGDPVRPQLEIVADTIPPPQQIGASLATVFYTFATTEVGGGGVARSLPAAGRGPADPSASVVWFVVAAVLAGVGLVLLVASIYRGGLRVRR
jgi:hypothetical protein